MKDPEKCGRMVEAVKNACDVPVTVKIRKGWDRNHVNFLEVAKICEQAGADAIALHARTRDQMYQPSADWNSIRQLKQAVSVPVIGNGDVTDAQSACRMLEETGCDFLMVGRGAMGNPWIFQQINVYLTESCRILPGPGIAERLVVMVRHIRALCEEKGKMWACGKHANMWPGTCTDCAALQDIDAGPGNCVRSMIWISWWKRYTAGTGTKKKGKTPKK